MNVKKNIENAIYTINFRIFELPSPNWEKQPDGTVVTFIGQNATDFTEDEYKLLEDGLSYLKSLAKQPLTGFSEACFDQNTFKDLIENVELIDETSKKDWNLSTTEYQEAILKAIAHKISEDTSYFND